MGKDKEAFTHGFQEAEYILNLFPNCSHPLLKVLINRGIGKVLLNKGDLTNAEKRLTEAIEISEKIVGDAYSLATKVFRIETRVKLKNLENAYQDCLFILKIDRKKRNNYLDLLYYITYYHAAIIKYQQEDFEKSIEYFSCFFANMQAFCKKFLNQQTYINLELKGFFKIAEYDKNRAKEDIKNYLYYSLEIFSAIYGHEHPFVKGYALKNYEMFQNCGNRGNIFKYYNYRKDYL